MASEQEETNQGKKSVPGAQPSERKEDNRVTDGGGEPKARTGTPENAEAAINPSAPGNTGTTPGTNAKNG